MNCLDYCSPMQVNFPHDQVLETATTFFLFLLLENSWLCIIMTIYFYFCKLLFGLVESTSDLMRVETHDCCYWTWECIFLGKRSKWTTWEWRNHRPVIAFACASYIHVSHSMSTSILYLFQTFALYTWDIFFYLGSNFEVIIMLAVLTSWFEQGLFVNKLIASFWFLNSCYKIYWE